MHKKQISIVTFAVALALAGAVLLGIEQRQTGASAGTTSAKIEPAKQSPLLPGQQQSTSSALAKEGVTAAQDKPTVPDLVYVSPEPSRRRPFDISIAQFAKDYDALAKAAEAGNADAAKKIVDALLNCYDAPLDQADLEGRMAEHARTTSPDDPSFKRSMHSITEHYQRCAVLSPERRGSYKYWMRRSAELGDGEARLRYVSGGEPVGRGGEKYWADLKQYRETASAYLDAEIAAGNPRALLVASHQYSGQQERYKLYVRDPIKAYAYYYAYLLTIGNAEGSDFFLESLIREQQGMSVDDISKATLLGKQIYQSCCNH